ncbi:hypothetical protein AKJ09_01536 [Labilithrix luteola]|uniref:Uncharacterized protein n=1 Tax=Labilithrix luteola TaxID=1391654 RepID=A0A0K1PMY0_9BACT|nr:hypothetical protein AKJ09_01536 [Labilithrix luteola]
MKVDGSTDDEGDEDVELEQPTRPSATTNLDAPNARRRITGGI